MVALESEGSGFLELELETFECFTSALTALLDEDFFPDMLSLVQ